MTTKNITVNRSYLAAGACIVFFVVSIVAHCTLGQDIRPKGKEVRPDYSQIFERFMVPRQKRPTNSKKASSLIVVTEPSHCDPCLRLEPILLELIEEGYDITTETKSEYSKRKTGRRIKAIPYLLFMGKDKDKVIYTKKGFATKEYITKKLHK